MLAWENAAVYGLFVAVVVAVALAGWAFGRGHAEKSGLWREQSS